MSNWWACPKCGRRLLWLSDAIHCPGERCKYTTPRPVVVRSADKDGDADRF